jgi:hypothetical protein
MSFTYDQDFSLWAQETAQLLRERRWNDLDLEHLIEEVEDLGKSERRALSSQLERTLIHLLKWRYQPEHRSDSWIDSINDGRVQIVKILKDNPSLKSFSASRLQEDYTDARRYAAKQTGLLFDDFPIECPFSIEQVFDDEWFPN